MTRAEHIAALVEALLADGVAPDAIGRAVAADVELGLRSVPRATADARTGTRLPEDWQPSERCIAYALDRGISRARISIEAEKFRNYWIAKSGRDATKRDWSATWRNQFFLCLFAKLTQKVTACNRLVLRQRLVFGLILGATP